MQPIKPMQDNQTLPLLLQPPAKEQPQPGDNQELLNQCEAPNPRKWQYIKADVELHLRGWDWNNLSAGVIFEEELFAQAPEHMGDCRDILATCSNSQKLQINYPIEIWCRIRKGEADRMSHSELEDRIRNILEKFRKKGCKAKPQYAYDLDGLFKSITEIRIIRVSRVAEAGELYAYCLPEWGGAE
jgi:hypothetical protein